MIARLRGRRVADHLRAIGVPADGVAAAEHRERAERVEAAAASRRRAIGPMAPLARTALLQPAVGRTSRVRTPPRRRPRSSVSSCRRSCWSRRSRDGQTRTDGTRQRMRQFRTCRGRAARRAPAAGERQAARSRTWTRRASRWTRPRADARRRSSRRSMRPQNSSFAATTISAAADGVGARTSATKSAIVTSVSWPTAEMTGTGARAMARATISSLNAQRSSIEPPPRADDDHVDARHAADLPQAAGDFERRLLALHARRADHEVQRCGSAGASTLMMSRMAAPSSEVTMPILRGRAGSGRLRAASKRPSCLQPLLQLIEGELQRAEALRLEVLADELILALGFVDRDPAARDDAQAVGRLELQVAQRRAEHEAADLRAVVLQREVQMPGVPESCSSTARPRPRPRRTRSSSEVANADGQLGDA